MQNKKITWVEERRYINTEPRLTGIKFVDVDVKIDDIHITGVARYGKYIVVRYVRKNVTTYAFYEPHEIINKNELVDMEFLKSLVATYHENEIIKNRIKELREFADKLEEHMRDLPVEIVVAIFTSKSHGHVEVRPARRMSNDEFNRYVSTCKSLNMRFDPTSKAWVYVPEWSQYVIVTYGP